MITIYFITKSAVAQSLGAEGISARTHPWSICEDGLDLLVNTAPARLVPSDEEERFLLNARILDLASGKIFGEHENITKLASIPEAFYPVSAGAVYAERIIEFLESEDAV